MSVEEGLTPSSLSPSLYDGSEDLHQPGQAGGRRRSGRRRSGSRRSGSRTGKRRTGRRHRSRGGTGNNNLVKKTGGKRKRSHRKK